MDVEHIASAQLEDFSARVFQHFGVPRADAVTAARVLASSDLRGILFSGIYDMTAQKLFTSFTKALSSVLLRSFTVP